MHARPCKACGANLVFCITPQGKTAPIDREPSPAGNVLIVHPKTLNDLLAIVLSGQALHKAQAQGTPLRTNHFATCPNAAQFKDMR